MSSVRDILYPRTLAFCVIVISFEETYLKLGCNLGNINTTM